MIIPDGPGLGIEVPDDIQERLPGIPHGEVNARSHRDGSVIDQ